MTEVRKGRQTPTKSIILPYTETRGAEAIDLYNASGRTAQEWQELLAYDILAVNEDGLWVHTKFCIEIPRRNGKNEVAVIREFYGLTHGEKILHTAHRTTTSTSASRRLVALMVAAGYEEVERIKKKEKYDKHFTYAKQKGLERIVLLGEGGGCIDFRTRSSSGGLGEGFDLLVIDEGLPAENRFNLGGERPAPGTRPAGGTHSGRTAGSSGRCLHPGGEQSMTTYQIQLLLLYLGYSPGEPDGMDGPTTQAAVKKFQQDFGGIGVDGIPGEETQKALKHAVAYGTLKRENATATENATGNATGAKNPEGWPAKHFDRTEFRCPCGKCGGFPVEPKRELVLAADQMREDFGTPVTIVPPDGHSGGSGVRCQAYNDSLSGSVPNSRHVQGKAIDFQAPGQTTARVEAYLAKLKAAGTIRYWYRISPGSWHMDIL